MANGVRKKWQTWQKAKTKHAKMRSHEADLDNSRVSRRTQDAEMRLLVQVSLHETHGLEHATCHGTHEHISLCTPDSAIPLNYIWKTKVAHKAR